MRILTPFWRSLRLLEHLLTGAAIALIVAAGRPLGLLDERVPDLVRWWHGRLCRALGLHIEVTGDLAPNALLVANHISWLDIPVIGAQGRIGFLAKAEVRRWLLICWMAEIALGIGTSTHPPSSADPAAGVLPSPLVPLTEAT